MKEVIRIDQPKKEVEKPVEFTHFLSAGNGYVKASGTPDSFEKIVYLGCTMDGDMFAAYSGDYIEIYKGHLNSGKY